MAVWANAVRTTLNTGISSATSMSGAGTVTVDAASGAYNNPPDPSGSTAYFVIVDDAASPTKYELFSYTGLTDNTTTLDLTSVTRNIDGNGQQDFSAGAVVMQDIPAEVIKNIYGITYDSGNDRYGFGTASPSYTIDVQGTGARQLQLKSTNTNAAHVRLSSASTNRRLIGDNGSGTVTSQIQLNDSDITLGGAATPTNDWLILDANGGKLEAGGFKIKETSAAVADTAAYGQVWVKNDAPCELWFTDDTGVDRQVVTKVAIGIACSNETTALTTGTSKAVYRMPFAMTLDDVRASVTTAPTGSTIIVDINESGSTIMTTNKLSIDATEKTSTTAATAPGITDSALADDAEITIDIDQVGSTVAGAGLKVWLIGRIA